MMNSDTGRPERERADRLSTTIPAISCCECGKTAVGTVGQSNVQVAARADYRYDDTRRAWVCSQCVGPFRERTHFHTTAPPPTQESKLDKMSGTKSEKSVGNDPKLNVAATDHQKVEGYPLSEKGASINTLLIHGRWANVVAILGGSLIIGVSIVLGAWLAWPRYASIGDSAIRPVLLDTRTGKIWTWDNNLEPVSYELGKSFEESNPKLCRLPKK